MNKSLKKERGAVAIITAILMMIFLVMGAFALDIGYYFVVKNRLQNAVDAAALNGADTIYRANNLNNFPTDFVTAAETAVDNALNQNGFPSSDPNITSTTVDVDWWDNSAVFTPVGHYHYPAVRVSMTYNAGVFFAKILDIANIGVNVTATAMTPIPNSIKPVIPFVISYCTIDKGWTPATPTSPGAPIPGGKSSFVVGKSSGVPYDSNFNCVADNISGALTAGSDILTVTGGDFKRLTVGTALRDEDGIFPNNTTIVGVGSATGTGICTTAPTVPCIYHLSTNVPAAILADNIITADSGPLGNWTPLVHDTSSQGGTNDIRSYIPPIAANTIVPGVTIGHEIRVQPGVMDSLYQATYDCWETGVCDLVTIPVVNGLPCPSGSSCPATNTNDNDFPLTGVTIAPTGLRTASNPDSNYPVVGFACVRIDSVDTGSTKQINASLVTGCPVYGEGGGLIYYGVLLPPVLVH